MSICVSHPFECLFHLLARYGELLGAGTTSVFLLGSKHLARGLLLGAQCLWDEQMAAWIECGGWTGSGQKLGAGWEAAAPVLIEPRNRGGSGRPGEAWMDEVADWVWWGVEVRSGRRAGGRLAWAAAAIHGDRERGRTCSLGEGR